VQGRERDISERKRLEREVLECTANERRRIGHDLHDGLGQYLAGIAFRAKALEQSLASGHAGQAAEARELAMLLSSAINHARSLARGLDPVNVETVGLPAALQNLAAETQKFFDVPCTLRCADNAPDIDPQAALALYRITQEAIHNAITHGDASFIEIDLSKDKSMVKLMVRDNGCGFKARPEEQGMGLRVMQYRARSLGGTFKVHSNMNSGTEIVCALPSENCTPDEVTGPRSGKMPIRS
jgi:two-component system sensor kinase FixL